MRGFWAAVGGIVVLGGGSVGLLALATRSSGSASASAPPVARPPPPAAAAPPPAPFPAAAEAAPPGLAAAPSQPPQRAPAPVTRPAPAPVLSRTMPSRARYLVTSAIQRQVPGLSRCLPRDRAPHPDSPPVRLAARRDVVSDDALGVLSLELEPLQDRLRIVDVKVELANPDGGRALSCAQAALRGRTLDVPGTVPGGNVTMPYVVQ